MPPPATGERTLRRNEPQFGAPNRISCDRTAWQFAYRSIWPPPANNPTYPGIKAFRKGVDEFHTYVRRNAHTIPNYAERHRYGERVSTAFAESTVNAVVGKRFAKRQQMRWSKRGAHLMLQTRTRVLDDTLRAKFQSWYPGLFHVRTPDRSEHDLAA